MVLLLISKDACIRFLVAGGYNDSSMSECQEALAGLPKGDTALFTGYKISGCRTQVVAGINYEIPMDDDGTKKPKRPRCSLYASYSLRGVYSIRKSSDKNDCVLIAKKSMSISSGVKTK